MAFLSQSPISFTYDGVLRITQEAAQTCQDDVTGLFEEFVCEEEEVTQNSKSGTQLPSKAKTTSEQTDRMGMTCRALLGAVSKPEDHLRRLDNALGRLVKFKIIQPLLKDDELARRACAVLERLPAEYGEYHEACDGQMCAELPSDYFTNEHCTRTTSNLKVTRYLPVFLLELAVLVALPISERQNWHGQATLSLVNMIADSLEYLLYMKPGANFDASRLLIVRSLLWSLWRRSLSLHRYYVLRVHLEFGFTYSVHRSLRLKGQRLYDIVCNHRQLAGSTTPEASALPNSACNLAYELLQSDPVLVGTDLTALLVRFNETFPDEPPQHADQRSDTTTLEQSNHQITEQTTRVDDSSVRNHVSHASHVNTCSGNCTRLAWNESSYRAISGAPAVSLVPIQEGRLQYCESSRRTMTVAQTWTSVQDGNQGDAINVPGISTCLHKTFCEVSHKAGCNSYWVHTTCVPIDQTMRNEVMDSINAVFEDSQFTLVYDHKIISMAAPDAGLCEVDSMEKLLATFLLCEWNLGAWTLFEAMKGAKNLQLLCKNNTLVSLHEVILSIHTRGSIELSSLLLSSYYLLRPSEIHGLSSIITVFQELSSSELLRHTNTRTMGVEEAGRLLSYRRVRDEKDQVLIWSLLIGVPPTSIPAQFWSYMFTIRTGYLMSSIPRVEGVPNLSWGPICPGCAIDNQDTFAKSQSLVWHDEQSEEGWIIKTSTLSPIFLKAIWQFCSLDGLRLERAVRSAFTHTGAIWSEFWSVHHRHGSSYFERKRPLFMGQLPTNGEEWHLKYRMAMNAYQLWSTWTLLRLPAACRRELLKVSNRYRRESKSVALIYPKIDGSTPEDPLKLSQMVDNLTLAVITSEKGDIQDAFWKWREVIKWDTNVYLPPFRERLINYSKPLEPDNL
ncbi:hypothetical protein EV356DRAFT_571831 [Viridothelium virens]|uniref:Heterokaryon incompatibility domain-containing protein n=1 Tax=Viridothelium virens TaxID=1048519 RepID=A0A6A6GSL3_VIRVR|nr:hypothetical protein EV356DRAFT_571831 [Viridothelium virens]